MIAKNNRTQEIKAKSLSPGKIVRNIPDQLTIKKKTSYKPPLPPSQTKPKLTEQEKVEAEYNHYKNISQTLFFEHNQLQTQFNNLQAKYENQTRQNAKTITFLQGQIANLKNQQKKCDKSCCHENNQNSSKEQKSFIQYLYKNNQSQFIFQKENHQPAIHKLKTDLNTSNYEKQRLREQLSYIQNQNIKQVQQLVTKNNQLLSEIAKLRSKQDINRTIQYQSTGRIDTILTQKHEWEKKKWQEDKQYLQKGIKQIEESWKNNYERMLKNKQQCTNHNKLLIEKLKTIDNRNYELVRQKNQLQARVTQYQHKMYSLKNSFEYKLNVQLDKLDIRHKEQLDLLKKSHQKKLSDVQTLGYDQGYAAAQRNEARKIQNYEQKIRTFTYEKNEYENQIRTINAQKKAMQNTINFLTNQTRKKNDTINQLQKQFDQKIREAQNRRAQDIKSTRLAWQEQIRKQRSTLETIETQIRNKFKEKQAQWKQILKDAQSTNQQLLQNNKTLRKEVSSYKNKWEQSKRQLEMAKDGMTISKFNKEEMFDGQNCRKDLEKFSQLNEQLRILKQQIKYHTEIEKDLQEANQYKIQSQRKIGQYKEEIQSLHYQLNDMTQKYQKIQNQYKILKQIVEKSQSSYETSFAMRMQQSSQREKSQSYLSQQLQLANLRNEEKEAQLQKLQKQLKERNEELQIAKNAFCQLQQKIVTIELSLTQSQKMYLQMIEENFKIKSDLEKSENSSRIFSDQLRRKQQQLQMYIDEHESISVQNKMLKSQNQNNSVSLNQTINVQYHQIIKEFSQKNLKLEEQKHQLEEQVKRLTNQVQKLQNRIERDIENYKANNELEKRSIVESLDTKKILIISLQTEIKNMRSTLALRQGTVKELKNNQVAIQKEQIEKNKLIEQHEKCIEQCCRREKALQEQNRNLQNQLYQKITKLEQATEKVQHLLQQLKTHKVMINDLQSQLLKASEELYQVKIQKIQLQNLQQRQFSSLLEERSSAFKGEGSVRIQFEQFMINNEANCNISNIVAKQDKGDFKTQKKQAFIIQQNNQIRSQSYKRQKAYFRQDKIIQNTVKVLIQQSSSNQFQQPSMNISQSNQGAQFYFSQIIPPKQQTIIMSQPLSEQQKSNSLQQ